MGFFVDKVGYEAVFSAVGVATLLFGAFYGFFLMPKLQQVSKALVIERAKAV